MPDTQNVTSAADPELVKAVAEAIVRFRDYLAGAIPPAPPSEPEPLTESEINRLVDVRFVAELLDCNVKTVRNMEAAGTLPRAIRLTSSKVVWRLGTLLVWIKERDQAAQAKQRRA